jgi:flavodoxin
MKIIVIYDSVFGNTERIAQVIGSALAPMGEVEVIKVDLVKPEIIKDHSLVIVGSPTRGFRPTPATQALLKAIQPGDLKGIKVAAFDTRISKDDTKSPFLRKFIDFFGYAARPIADRLKSKGGDLLLMPEGFYVKGSEGPLKDGELKRAADWSVRLMGLCPPA